MVHPYGPEKAKARGKVIDIETRRDAGPQVLQTIGQRVSQFEVSSCTRLLHMVAADGNRVEFRHVRRSVPKDVPDNPHRGCRWVDIGVADHKLLQNVILDRPSKLLRPDALLFGRYDIKAITGRTAPLIVIETDIWPRGISLKRIFMSSTVSIATPALPTSLRTRSWSESYPRCVGRSKATDRPF